MDSEKKCKEGFDTREGYKEIAQMCKGTIKKRQMPQSYVGLLGRKSNIFQWDLLSGKDG